MWKVQIPAKHNLAAFRAQRESVCIVFQGQCLLLVINNVNNSCSAFFHSFSHQWYTLSHLCHIPPFGPSLPHPTSDGNQKPPGLARRVPPRRPAGDIIYGSRYDVDSSINKGLSLLLFQPSQSFQRYLSEFPACAGRIVGAAEKHTCWNGDKILQSALQIEMRASLTTESQIHWCSFAGTAVSNGDVIYLFLCEKKTIVL